MLGLLLAFAGGFGNEALAVFWVHHSEAGRPHLTGLCAALQGLCVLVGVGEAVRDWHHGPAFLVGLYAGAAGAVWLKGGRSP